MEYSSHSESFLITVFWVTDCLYLCLPFPMDLYRALLPEPSYAQILRLDGKLDSQEAIPDRVVMGNTNDMNTNLPWPSTRPAIGLV
jgi:hypothetical protein